MYGKISEKQQNDVSKWRHTLETGHGMRKNQNISQMMMNDFNHDQLFLGTKFQGLKQLLNDKISEKWQSDVSKWSHTSETGYVMKTEFFKMSLWWWEKTSTMIDFSIKTSVRVSNGNYMVILVNNDKMTSLKTVISQEQDIVQILFFSMSL